MTKKINFSNYSSIKIGPLIEVEILEDDFSNMDKLFLVGGANNILISHKPPPLAVLSKKYEYISLDEKILKVGGGTASGRLHSFCKKNNLGGLEFLGKLPGKIGGLVKMNAGMKEYEIFEFLTEIRTDKKVYKKDEINFAYRYTDIKEVILEATFKIEKSFDETKLELFENMRKNQPKDPSAGSAFKNPKGDSAGRLIDAVGLKGYRKGDMAWSEIHGNFLVNLGAGNFEDAIYLIELAKKKVKEKFGVVLEEEIIIL